MSHSKEEATMSARDWETLYRKYFPTLGHYFASQGLSPADAEDLAQETFQRLGQGKVPHSPNAYIYAIAKNVLANYRRRTISEQAFRDKYRRRVTTNNECSASHTLDSEPPEEASATQAGRLLRAVTARLSPKDVELMTLRFIEGLPIRQVAQRMSCSENAVSKRIHMFRTLLRQFKGE